MSKKLAEVKSSEKKIEITYSLRNVITGKYSYQMPSKDIGAFEVNYIVTPSMTSNIESNSVYIKLTVNINIVGTEEKIADIETIFDFYVQDLKNHMKFENGNNVFDKGYHSIFVTFIGISISTLRGILIEKHNGTILDNKIMPVMNPSSFLHKTP